MGEGEDLEPTLEAITDILEKANGRPNHPNLCTSRSRHIRSLNSPSYLRVQFEKEKRGVYAGAVGYFGYGSVDTTGNEVEREMDTCIALRTMLYRDGVAYLHAGGGIVFDSDPYDEYITAINKLGANMTTFKTAEQKYSRMQKEKRRPMEAIAKIASQRKPRKGRTLT